MSTVAGVSIEAVRAANLLTARWAATLSGQSSALSGVGLWPLLGLLAAGADGQARTELTDALGLPADGAEVHALAMLNTVAASVGTDAALGLWARAEVPFTQWWTKTIPAESRRLLTGDPDVDQANMDAWVAERTQGLLKHMPVSASSTTLLVLASAISVHTTWAEPLEDMSWKVEAGPWAGEQWIAGLSGESLEVDRVCVAPTPIGQLTCLAMIGTGDIDVHLVLGEPNRGAAEVLPAAVVSLAGDHPKISASDLPLGMAGPGIRVGSKPAFRPDPMLTFTTTRFTVTASHDLQAHSRLFGLSTASGPGLHFPRITPQPVPIGQAQQDVTATFSAKGFEAAAVTAMMFPTSAQIPQHVVRTIEVKFDRPFGFVVNHRPTGLILLVGWVASPELRSDQ
jgi:serine protease inhibitor